MKTWEDIERAALTNLVLHRAVTLVRRGDMTREQALIHASLGLVEQVASLETRLLAELSSKPARPMRMQEDAL